MRFRLWSGDVHFTDALQRNSIGKVQKNSAPPARVTSSQARPQASVAGSKKLAIGLLSRVVQPYSPLVAATQTDGEQRHIGRKAMRQDIAFKTSDGTTLRGWHYLPAGAGPFPTIVMAHGFSAVKEMYLRGVAEPCQAASHPGRRQPQFRRERRWTTPGDRPLAPDPGLPDAITFAKSLVNRPSHWDLGVELQRRPRAGGRRDRPAGEMRGRAGARDQRVTGLSTTGSCRPHRRLEAHSMRIVSTAPPGEPRR